MTDHTIQPWRRSLAAFLALLMAAGPLANPAYAALTDLADDPIAFRPKAEPNIVMTVDDSTSMLADFLPDFIIGQVPNSGGVPGFCRDSTGLMNAACGTEGGAKLPPHIFSFTNIPYPTYADGNPPNPWNYSPNSSVPSIRDAWVPPMHANALNRLYYDPAITYTPPVDANGTSYPNITTYTAVRADPWSTEVKNVNLTSTVSVPLYCNSTFPNVPNPLALNQLQMYRDHCRINGTDYSGSAVAPAAGDYQYPWQKFPNTAATPDDPKYFWRVGGNKTIYCDTTHPKFPKTCTLGAWTCKTGTYKAPPTLPQVCVAGTVKMGCNPAVPTDYSPVGCNTDPKAAAPIGTCKGAECTPCACNNSSRTGQNGACRDAVTKTGGSGSNCGCDDNPLGVSCALKSCSNYSPGGMGTCSDGSEPVRNETCSAASGNCSLFLVDPVTGNPTTTTLFDDAEGAGEVCRRNNRLYPNGGDTFAPFAYPSGKYTNARSGGAGCTAIPDRVTIPRHYWKTSIEWCANRIITNDKWRGYGLYNGPGSCQDERDATYRWPRFYKYGVAKGSPEHVDNYTYGAFERVDLVAGSTYTHTFIRNGTPETITRDYAAEMTNYANWFAYYRTRLQAAKTVISYAFSFLNDDFRVGFHTLSNEPPSSFVNVAPFDSTQKTQWYTQLFGVTVPMGYDTPNMDAIVRIGELFRTGAAADLPGATDPIVLSCQRNYHVLFTDGMQNQFSPPSKLVGNQDNTISIAKDLPLETPPLINGAAWPKRFREDTANPVSDSLSDFATYYWATDLRPSMEDNVPAGSSDPATWQHVNLFGLSLGTEGILNANSVKSTEEAIANTASTLKWPTPTGTTYKPTTGGVDDLWHAAVNSRGGFINAKTPQELARGLIGVLTAISNAKGTDSGAGIGNPNLSPTNNSSYIASFDGSSGTVKKIRLNEQTGEPEATLWDAADSLGAQLSPTADAPEPWFTERRVVTRDATGSPIPFLYDSLSAAQRSTLGATAQRQQDVIEYLRGNRAKEGGDDGQFRVRTSLFGDVVNASPVPVGPPQWPYLDAYDPGYSAFKEAYKTRPKRVYVASNDGMVHALDDADDGKEAWAYIPSVLFRGAPNDREGLVGLSYQVGGLPFYQHRFMVNATPRAVDVDFGGGNWRTILVGGMGKGGKTYYALDVTDPASVTDEASAASKVLWEFSAPTYDIGYTFGRPLIAKTRAFGWVVVLPSGYNNASGRGKIFFLDPQTGGLLKTMETTAGGAGDDAGLAHIAGYTKDYRDQTLEQVYGGDLKGNLWRFDVSDPDPGAWQVEQLASLTDGSGTPQPITTEPQIEVDISTGVDRWVFVGTGRLLHENDLESTQQQTMYAIRDGTHDQPKEITSVITRSDLQVISDAVGLGTGVIAEKGWYDDVPAGTRIISHPQATVGIVGYIATGLGVDPCEPGQPAHVFVRGFGNGESALLNTAGDTIVESIYVAEGGASIDIVATHNPACASGDCIPNIKMLVTTKFNSTQIALNVRMPGLLEQHRMSWRLLGQ